jgi:biofilm PGA synthesis N-glycosyltransferase PgaC
VALVAIICCLVVAYTYVGYPLLIALLARLWPHPPQKNSAYLPYVSVCVPIYNAATYLPDKVASLQALDYPPDRLEFLLYSDGSTDDTRAVAEALAAKDPRVRVIVSERRRGKPTALNVMAEQARGEVLMLTDVRQPVVSGALRALVPPLCDPAVGCVSGNLVLQGSTGAGAYWRYENAIRKAEGRFRGMVGVTGPLYAVRRTDLSPLPEDIILDDMMVPLRLQLAYQQRVVFAPEAVAYDQAFDDEREFGRKARTLAGNYQLLTRLPGLLLPFHYGLWFEFFSHKLLRLLCPWLLLAMLAASLAGVLAPETGSEWRSALTAVLMVGQVVFYALALMGTRGGKFGRLARTFIVMNAAAVVGLWRFMRDTQRVTW